MPHYPTITIMLIAGGCLLLAGIVTGYILLIKDGDYFDSFRDYIDKL